MFLAGHQAARGHRFTRDYGQKLYEWIRENYHPISRIGAPPLQTDDFGILLLGTSGR